MVGCHWWGAMVGCHCWVPPFSAAPFSTWITHKLPLQKSVFHLDLCQKVVLSKPLQKGTHKTFAKRHPANKTFAKRHPLPPLQKACPGYMSTGHTGFLARGPPAMPGVYAGIIFASHSFTFAFHLKICFHLSIPGNRSLLC